MAIVAHRCPHRGSRSWSGSSCGCTRWPNRPTASGSCRRRSPTQRAQPVLFIIALLVAMALDLLHRSVRGQPSACASPASSAPRATGTSWHWPAAPSSSQSGGGRRRCGRSPWVRWPVWSSLPPPPVGGRRWLIGRGRRRVGGGVDADPAPHRSRVPGAGSPRRESSSWPGSQSVLMVHPPVGRIPLQPADQGQTLAWSASTEAWRSSVVTGVGPPRHRHRPRCRRHLSRVRAGRLPRPSSPTAVWSAASCWSGAGAAVGASIRRRDLLSSCAAAGTGGVRGGGRRRLRLATSRRSPSSVVPSPASASEPAGAVPFARRRPRQESADAPASRSGTLVVVWVVLVVLVMLVQLLVGATPGGRTAYPGPRARRRPDRDPVGTRPAYPHRARRDRSLHAQDRGTLLPLYQRGARAS